MKIERTFSVKKKELKGPRNLPSVTMKSVEGDKLTLKLEEKQHLDNFEIDQLWQIRICDEQQTLDPKEKFAAGISTAGQKKP